eukprot:gnl/Spiro4/21326_TR10414_c0_g1_i1.p1 gnl/Spiro4/21326_TR10414_c0_g1~~gnl/Spiro4/21326_TR10414_c0_g1_i1.p1  ORF type:complete len:160 (+),score=15.84 gnl/Spiro4/21326_TR10414_c0_g1_i1:101-580(+)
MVEQSTPMIHVRSENFVTLVRRETFSSAHRLACKDSTYDENRELFGPCFNLHGHNYTLEVKLRGPVDPVTGMVVNLRDLKKIMQQHVLDVFDHQCLEDADFFRTTELPTTVENLCLAIWSILEPLLPRVSRTQSLLHSVKIFETDKNAAVYHGPRRDST